MVSYALFDFQGRPCRADLSRPIDLSIRLRNGFDNPNCFWASPPTFEPVRAGNFVGSTAEGGAVNFFNVRFNPHGNGTHTECVGHISKEHFVLPECLRHAHFTCKLASVYPQRMESGDRVVTYEQLAECIAKGEADALVLRTLPNPAHKPSLTYSGTNPPYIHADALAHLVESGIQHLLVDLPSVDREEDGGALAGHKAFWQYPSNIRREATITELVYVPDEVPDGYYLLNLQTAAFDMDASPSRPVLYPISFEG
jgi:arylformamidase